MEISCLYEFLFNISRFFLQKFEIHGYIASSILSHAIMENQLKWAPTTVVDWKNFMRVMFRRVQR